MYKFEPSHIETMLTSFVGNTLLRNYYSKFVEGLEIHDNDRILDYGCGCGIITRMIAKKLKSGHLTYIDVSKKWLEISEHRLRKHKNAEGKQINDFTCQIGQGKFDKIVVHYTLHDFPKVFQKPIINQLVAHLQPKGLLIIREPISRKHGVPLYEIYKLLESIKEITSKYVLHCNEIMGDYAEITCKLNIRHNKVK